MAWPEVVTGIQGWSRVQLEWVTMRKDRAVREVWATVVWIWVLSRELACISLRSISTRSAASLRCWASSPESVKFCTSVACSRVSMLVFNHSNSLLAAAIWVAVACSWVETLACHWSSSRRARSRSDRAAAASRAIWALFCSSLACHWANSRRARSRSARAAAASWAIWALSCLSLACHWASSRRARSRSARAAAASWASWTLSCLSLPCCWT
mmetsp:Transcript_136263/g.308052  ORF Transcript_136263/g.308052 Transcript_136263/m.308052 type:complete len:213 (-) Transcript_136263:328-966(-)